MYFLSQYGLSYLTDINTGRFNGAHFPKYFVERYGNNNDWIAFKHLPPANLPIQLFWKRAKQIGIAFDYKSESGVGVIPLVYIDGMSGLFLGLATDPVGLAKIRQQTEKCLRPPTAEELAALAGPEDSAPEVSPGQSLLNITLLKYADVIYTPTPVRNATIWLVEGKVAGVIASEESRQMEHPSMTVIDLTGMVVMPGFVDMHVHLIGGGGEQGPMSRTPEAQFDELVAGGLTTVVGVLGTDSLSRSLDSLVAKCRGLNDLGLTAFMWTGAYQVPPPTVTGSVSKDIVLIEQIIGCGEIAISDHRGSQPTKDELARLAADCRVGGMLAGKCGVLYCHIGPCKPMLKPLMEVIEETDIPIQNIVPTHCHRSTALIDQTKQWIAMGGYADFTASAVGTPVALNDYRESNVDLSHVTCSTDAYGSAPVFDENGKLLRYSAGDPRALIRLVRKLVLSFQWSIEEAIQIATINPANVLKLEKKGRIAQGADADILVLDSATLNLHYVFANGEMVRSPTYVKKDMFH